MNKLNLNAKARAIFAATFSLSLLLAPAVRAQTIPASTQPDGQAVALDALMVTASRTEHPAKVAPATVSIISRTDLLTSTGEDLLNSIRQIAGLNLNGRGVGGRKVFMLRGMESHHSLIMVDGRRISATNEIVGHSDFQYDWAPVDVIQQIEIVRGPMSALYGSEAMGGVVNIVTTQPTPDWSGTLDAGGSARFDGRGGEHGRIGFSTSGNLASQLSLRLSASYQHTADTPSEQTPTASELEGQEIYGINAIITWTPAENQSFELFLDRNDEDRWRDTSSRRGQLYRSTYNLRRQIVGLRWQTRIGEWSGTVNAYETQMDVVNEATNGVSPFTPQFLIDRIADASFSRAVGDHHLVTFGGEWREEELIHPAFTAGESSAVHAAGFLQDEWSLRQDLTLTAAARFDHHEFFGEQVSPRAYLVWQTSPQLTLKGGYGAGFKAPTLKQSSAEYRFVGPHTFLGNGDIDPESSDSWEISALYTPTPNLNLVLTAFRNDVDDLITTQCIANCSARFGRINQYVNLESSRIDGMEAELAWSPHERLLFNATHTWLDAQDLTSDLHLPGRPDHRTTASLRYTIVPDRLRGVVSFEYNGSEWVRETAGESRLPSYSLAHAGLIWNVNDRQDLIVNVTNIGDTDLSAKSTDYGYAEPGRSASVRWRLRF